MSPNHLKIAIIAPPWLPVPPERYGGVEWVVSLLADRLAELGHDVTLFACGGSITQAKLVTTSEDAEHRAVRAALSGAGARPAFVPAGVAVRHRLRPLRARRGGDGRPREGAGRAHGAQHAQRRARAHLPADLRAEPAPAVHLHVAQAARARRGPAVGRELPERPRPRRVPVLRPPRRLPAVRRADEPAEGRRPRDRRRAGDGRAADARRQDARGRRARVLLARGRAAPERSHPVPRRGVARGEGAAAAARSLHDLPDRLGGAVRPRHARVDGVRHARRRDAPRRRARGDLARRVGRDRRPLRGPPRRRRAGRPDRSGQLPGLRRDALLRGAHGAQLPRGVLLACSAEAAARAPAAPSRAPAARAPAGSPSARRAAAAGRPCGPTSGRRARRCGRPPAAAARSSPRRARGFGL